MSERLKPELPKGFEDRSAQDIKASARMVEALTRIFELYGFEALETPFFEYSEALGKFLPDAERPNAGVFSLQDDDENWLSLRYDLTAPLARYVAKNFQHLARPYRSYREGWVFRNEKPGPGRFRQFRQVDADIVGSSSPAADAEIAMLAADCYQRLGFDPGHIIIKINNRKVLDGLLDAALGVSPTPEGHLTIMRAIDKLDRLGLSGVEGLLGDGRLDESGDYTRGAGLNAAERRPILSFLEGAEGGSEGVLSSMSRLAGSTESGREGIEELTALIGFVRQSGYTDEEIILDPSVVRGLDYYTGPVFEAQSSAEGSAFGGGGRYDGLVSRFRPEPVPATGFSVGVSRVLSALKARQAQGSADPGPVVVTVMDAERLGDYLAIASQLRSAGIRAETYLGGSGMKAQLKYADRRSAPLVIIQGSDEAARGTVMIKDLMQGAELARSIDSNETWRKERPAQIEVSRDDLVEEVTVRLTDKGGLL